MFKSIINHYPQKDLNVHYHHHQGSKFVIAKMAQKVRVEIKTTIIRSNGNNLSSETIALVQEFYDSHDIS